MNWRVPLLLAAALLAGCANPEKDWELASRDDSPETYLEFLAKHPDSAQADLARARIQELKVIRTWERAEFKDSEDTYTEFVQKYPDSDFVPEATERIETMQRARQWEFVTETGSAEALTGFISSYPDAPEREEAEAMLAEIRLAEEAARPKERPGAFRLQLAAFRTASAAEAELRRLIEMFPTELLGPIRIATPAEQGNGNLFLLKTVPMSGAEAREICALLKSRQQQCMIINK